MGNCDQATALPSSRIPLGSEPEANRQPEPGGSAAFDYWDSLLCVAVVVGVFVIIYTGIRRSFLSPVILEAEHYHWARLILRPAMLWGTMGSILLAFRTVLWFRYTSAPPSTAEAAPPLTVVIPAYNEGSMVLHSIESVARSHYPRQRLELIVVDDGSTDDTWKYIQVAAARYPDLVTALRHEKNRGKREALATAFAQARGEIAVTLDSDSVIEPQALLAITGPFRDPTIGAVAGKVKVYNRDQGLIPRMLHVRYIVSFDFLRASESGFATVYCCPGALTAYRIAIVRQVLPRWLQQTFLGARCTVGEDRALTNLVLASGYNTCYQRSAVVETVVPHSYKKLCRMFLRWDRSYIREEICFLRIVNRRPLATRIVALFDRLTTNLRYPVHYASLLLLVLLAQHHPWMLVRLFIVIALLSALNTLYYLRSERSPAAVYGVIYSYFSLLALFWIFPVALCTVRSRSWLTR